MPFQQRIPKITVSIFPFVPQAVFGVLSSIEGLDAFNDMLYHTGIGAWYKRTKRAVRNKDGTR